MAQKILALSITLDSQSEKLQLEFDLMQSPTPLSGVSPQGALYLFHHVFFPPKLPGESDYDPKCELLLIDYLVNALRTFEQYVPEPGGNFACITTMITRMRTTFGPHGDIEELGLTGALGSLAEDVKFLPVFVREQNAGILFSRKEDAIQLESFELSPRNESVITTTGRLTRVFPGPAILISLKEFQKREFRQAIAQTLAQMSHQPVIGLKPKVKKAKEEHDEDRDTTNPKMVTEFLMATLRPMSMDTRATQVRKHTREEVMWHNSRSPWRRSALWLLLRVSLQIVCRRTSETDQTDDLYKSFMIHFMTLLLDEMSNGESGVSGEMIFVMSAKITRRLLKLKPPGNISWLRRVEEILGRESRIASERWHGLVNNVPDIDLSALPNLDFLHDTKCNLPHLAKYIERVQERGHEGMELSVFQATGKVYRFASRVLPSELDFSDEDYQVYNLASLEKWVADNLDEWIESFSLDPGTCGALQNLMVRYHEIASHVYRGNPERISVMQLTLLELWIACDKSAVAICDLLAQYDCLVPIQSFQSLLLPFSSQMARLAKAEQYLHERHGRASSPRPGIFTDYGTKSCFAVQYFDQSGEHQRLLADIERSATQAKNAKIGELRAKQDQYTHLMQRFDEVDCDYVDVLVDWEYERQHSASCVRHKYKSRADSLSIQISEWPLPSHLEEAKSVVFELMVPSSFRSWRDTTLFFLTDCLNLEYFAIERPRSQYRLDNYAGLSSFHECSRGSRRVCLLSQNKPHLNTHRKHRAVVNIRESDVCLKNGLKFQYFDGEKRCFITDFEATLRMASSCTYKLPSSSSVLEKFIFRPADSPDGPPPNTTIATQDSTPIEMTLGEYKSLANLPLGLEIQWLNILVEISSPGVDWKKVETLLFVQQIIHQAGPAIPSNTFRKGHQILEDRLFAERLLSQMESMRDSIKENWELIHGLNSLIRLTLRILTLNPSEGVCHLYVTFLKKLRRTAFHWVSELKGQARQMVDSDQRAQLVSKSVHFALVCTETFNTETIETVIGAVEDVSVYLQCSTIIYNGQSSLHMDAGSVMQILFHRWQCLSYQTYARLAACIISQQSAGIDLAMQEAWAAYTPGPTWSVASEVAMEWLCCQSAAPETPDHMTTVHYNVLTGQILVDGLPLSHLPADYEAHPTYRTIFGRAHLEVMPSNLPGLDFSCQAEYQNHQVHLGKESVFESNADCLMIRAMGEAGDWEYIPPKVFAGVFPDSILEDYVHWYAVQEGYVEFRPVETPWSSCAENWRLHRVPGSTLWRLEKEGTLMVHNTSLTAIVLSRIFRPVETSTNIHYCVNTGLSSLHVALPRLRLDFSLAPRSLSVLSRQYPDMIIDKNQSLGSLVGLQSKIILTSPKTKERLVLIPGGKPAWRKKGNHVRIDVKQPLHVKMHAYPVDNQLGRLVDSGSLQNQLFLAYLHALTSHYLPDPLTGRTGTEQALTILRSASVRSFSQLQSGEIALLTMIAALTPQRRFYPANERVMQTASWNEDFPSLSQHHGFRVEVDSLLEQNRRTRFLFAEREVPSPRLPHVELDLSLRDRIRTSCFHITGFGAEDHTQSYDCVYEGLDANRTTSAASRSFRIGYILYRNVLHGPEFSVEAMESCVWGFLTQFSELHGKTAAIPITRLRYDSEWMRESENFIAQYWCAIHRIALAPSRPLNRYQVMMWLSTIAFSGNINMEVLQVVASMFLPTLGDHVRLPDRPRFQPQHGYVWNRKAILNHIKDNQVENPVSFVLTPDALETPRSFNRRRGKLLKQNRSTCCEQALEHFAAQWPTRAPSRPQSTTTLSLSDYLHVRKILRQVSESFNTWQDNRELKEYVVELILSISRQRAEEFTLSPYEVPFDAPVILQNTGFLSLQDCLDSLPPLFPQAPVLSPLPRVLSTFTEPSTALLRLAQSLEVQASSRYEKWYVGQLNDSVASMREVKHMSYQDTLDGDLTQGVQDYVSQCANYSKSIYKSLVAHMCPTEEDTFRGRARAIALAGSYFPRLSPLLMVEQLSHDHWHRLRDDWKRCFIAYGLSLTNSNRAKRLADSITDRDAFLKELTNAGHTNWDPFHFPETLLLEVESGILVRDVQEDIAKIMRDASQGQNIVMQLNMGEGKSSVIIPIVAVANADGKNLVRVIVAKPQSHQMFQMLVGKLGGILGRKIYHLPITRSLKIGIQEAKEIESMCNECKSSGGVLLVQPEHILSLRLKCVECFISGEDETGRSMFRILELFREHARDLVDESDENFNVRFELVYTMGIQHPTEFSPYRWMAIQEVLDLVRKYALVIRENLPESIEVSESHVGSFPRIRLLDRTGAEALVRYIGEHICEHGISGLPVARQPPPTRDLIMKYITQNLLAPDSIFEVEDKNSSGFWGQPAQSTLLLLRGLLAGGILAFCLGQKRWRVNYGPDSNRRPPTRLCVPYRAKDSPSSRSEFSHPDVVIVLTCLSFYYSGLSDDDLFLCFDHLVKSDQSDAEYQAWVDDAPMLDSAYRQLIGVNIEDRRHCISHIFPAFRWCKASVDYYLANLVFPKEIREFPNKLSASGWDLGQIQTHAMVGFSGTNDSRKTLPLSVHQLDLPAQNHTNALVLNHLLREQNSVTSIPRAQCPKQSNTQILLDLVSTLDPPAQVILDVGAQILEYGNRQVAEIWLKTLPVKGTTQAIVFVDEDDVISVVDRSGCVEPLQNSPYARRMEACFVFLDEAHTRGIDLKLPRHYRAAVTLGQGVTKDKLVQACMRMRKLGHGQSVAFCVPSEILHRIKSLPGRGPRSEADVTGVLQWAISETWRDTQRCIPLWAAQGTRFERQVGFWKDLISCDCAGQTSNNAKKFLEPESQPLLQRYRPGSREKEKVESFNDLEPNLIQIKARCMEFEGLDHGTSALQEEQERELAPERQSEREVQRPAPATPQPHQIHSDLLFFITAGDLRISSEAYRPAFHTLCSTSAAECLDCDELPADLLATADFCRTVQLPSNSQYRADSYQRNVRWILTTRNHQNEGRESSPVMMIISPYEANLLMPRIRNSRFVTLHLYGPRQKKNHPTLDRLTLFNIPHVYLTAHIPNRLRTQLNFFSGQLYIESYSEYMEICEFLGVASVKTHPGLIVGPGGFIERGTSCNNTTFRRSPLGYFQILMSQIRKDCQDIRRTHMGQILSGGLLFPSDFIGSPGPDSELVLR